MVLVRECWFPILQLFPMHARTHALRLNENIPSYCWFQNKNRRSSYQPMSIQSMWDKEKEWDNEQGWEVPIKIDGMQDIQSNPTTCAWTPTHPTHPNKQCEITKPDNPQHTCLPTYCTLGTVSAYCIPPTKIPRAQERSASWNEPGHQAGVCAYVEILIKRRHHLGYPYSLVSGPGYSSHALSGFEARNRTPYPFERLPKPKHLIAEPRSRRKSR